MRFLSHLFDNNRKWAAKIKRKDPEYFERLSKIQQPEYLWIGCADSRVTRASGRAFGATLDHSLAEGAEKYWTRLTATSETNMTPV